MLSTGSYYLIQLTQYLLYRLFFQPLVSPYQIHLRGFIGQSPFLSPHLYLLHGQLGPGLASSISTNQLQGYKTLTRHWRCRIIQESTVHNRRTCQALGLSLLLGRYPTVSSLPLISYSKWMLAQPPDERPVLYYVCQVGFVGEQRIPRHV